MSEPSERDPKEGTGELPADPPGDVSPTRSPGEPIPAGGILSSQSGHDGRFYWPAADRPPAETECVETACEVCGQVWVSHVDMAGFRLRCRCEAWVTIPVPAGHLLLQTPEAEGEVAGPPALVSERGLMSIPELKDGEVFEAPVSTSIPMAPGTLRQANATTQRRWTERTLFEVLAIMAAFLLPATCLALFLDGRSQALAMPLADLVTGVLVIAIGFTAGVYTFGGLRASKLAFLLEGALVGLAGAAVAVAYTWFWKDQGMSGDDFLLPLVEELGLLGAIFVIGFCPAVFEELAFRGLLQGRLMALYGTKLGIVVTGTAFALAHGVTAGFPFHVIGGIYLCSLRLRSDSLYPCMLTHFLYNSTLVIATSEGIG